MARSFDDYLPNPARPLNRREEAIVRETVDIVGASDMLEECGLPYISITYRRSADWHGRHVNTLNRHRVLSGRFIEVQWYATKTPEALSRVLTHETVHDVQYMTEVLSRKPKHRLDDGHGPDFLEMAARINAVKGADYVTVVSDRKFSEQAQYTKLFALIVADMADMADMADKGFAWRHAPRDRRRAILDPDARVLIVRSNDICVHRSRIWSDPSTLWSSVPKRYLDLVRAAYAKAPRVASPQGRVLLRMPLEEAYERVGLDLMLPVT